MLNVQKLNARRQDEGEDALKRTTYIPSKLFTITDLTNQQVVDNRVKMDLVQSTMLPPLQGVEHLNTLLRQIYEHNTLEELLNRWDHACIIYVTIKNNLQQLMLM